MTEEQSSKLGRRQFFRSLGGGVAIVVATTAPILQEAQAGTENSSDNLKRQYQETEHVKSFYRVNRYSTK